MRLYWYRQEQEKKKLVSHQHRVVRSSNILKVNGNATAFNAMFPTRQRSPLMEELEKTTCYLYKSIVGIGGTSDGTNARQHKTLPWYYQQDSGTLERRSCDTCSSVLTEISTIRRSLKSPFLGATSAKSKKMETTATHYSSSRPQTQ